MRPHAGVTPAHASFSPQALVLAVAGRQRLPGVFLVRSSASTDGSVAHPGGGGRVVVPDGLESAGRPPGRRPAAAGSGTVSSGHQLRFAAVAGLAAGPAA